MLHLELRASIGTCREPSRTKPLGGLCRSTALSSSLLCCIARKTRSRFHKQRTLGLARTGHLCGFAYDRASSNSSGVCYPLAFRSGGRYRLANGHPQQDYYDTNAYSASRTSEHSSTGEASRRSRPRTSRRWAAAQLASLDKRLPCTSQSSSGALCRGEPADRTVARNARRFPSSSLVPARGPTSFESPVTGSSTGLVYPDDRIHVRGRQKLWTTPRRRPRGRVGPTAAQACLPVADLQG
jgi:hypothetical protein